MRSGDISKIYIWIRLVELSGFRESVLVCYDRVAGSLKIEEMEIFKVILLNERSNLKIIYSIILFI